MIGRGLTDECRLFLRLCLRLDHTDIAPALRLVSHLKAQHASEGPIEPADLLYYLKTTTTNTQTYVDELCRLLYVIDRHDLVAKYVAPFDSGILSVPEPCRHVHVFKCDTETLAHRVADLLPRMYVRIIARSSALSRDLQRQVLQQPVSGSRLLLSLLRVHQPGFVHCLWDWCVELDLEAPLKVMENYMVSVDKPRLHIAAPPPTLTLSGSPPLAKRVYIPAGSEFHKSTAPPLSSLDSEDMDTQLYQSGHSQVAGHSVTQGTPTPSLTVAHAAYPGQHAKSIYTESSDWSQVRPGLSAHNVSADMVRDEQHYIASVAREAEHHAGGSAHHSGNEQAVRPSPSSPVISNRTPERKASPELQHRAAANTVQSPPSALSVRPQNSAATRILSKLSQNRGPASTEDNTAGATSTAPPAPPSARYPSVLQASSGDAPSVQSKLVTLLGPPSVLKHQPSTRSAGSLANVGELAPQESSLSAIHTRQGYDTTSSGKRVPLLSTTSDKSHGTTMHMSPPTSGTLSTANGSQTTGTQLRRTLDGSTWNAVLPNPPLEATRPQAQRLAASALSPPRVVKLGPMAEPDRTTLEAKGIGDSALTAPGKDDSGNVVEEPVEKVDTGMSSDASCKLYPDLSDALASSKGRHVGRARTPRQRATARESSTEPNSSSSSSSEEDLYYSARDSPGSTTDGGAAKRRPRRPAFPRTAKKAYSRKTRQ